MIPRWLIGGIIGILVGAAFASVTILAWETVVWGWGEPVPDWMVVPSLLWGMVCGAFGAWVGATVGDQSGMGP